MGDQPDPAKDWLAKAENDLASAKVLGSAPSPLLDTAIYHCQQAGEKALKSVLARKGKPIQKRTTWRYCSTTPRSTVRDWRPCVARPTC